MSYKWNDDAQGKGREKKEMMVHWDRLFIEWGSSGSSSVGGKLSEQSWTSYNSTLSNKEVTGIWSGNLAR